MIQLRYNAIKNKLHEYPNNRFLVWTIPAVLEVNSTPEAGALATAFADWVMTSWDESGDNIFVWDFRTLETNGGDFAPPENVRLYGDTDDHPNEEFAAETSPKLAKRIIDVLEGVADTTSLTGE